MWNCQVSGRKETSSLAGRLIEMSTERRQRQFIRQFHLGVNRRQSSTLPEVVRMVIVPQ